MDDTESPETTGTAGSGPATSPPLTAAEPPPSAASTSGLSDPSRRKHGKRERVALACQRCKTRKQKCDGSRPACGSCARLSLKCVYIVPLVPAAGEKKLYIKALEQRIAELESQLSALGQPSAGEDHLRSHRLSSISSAVPTTSYQQQASATPFYQFEQAPSDDEGNDILVAVRDLSLSASGHYVGATSSITIGRVLSSVVQSQRSLSLVPRIDQGAQDDDPTPKSICPTRMTDMIGVQILSPQVAQRLLQGWFTHIATRYPVLLTPRLLHLHANRDNLTDIYEKSILHLVYAISGRWLESSGEMGHFFSDQHYDLAFEAMDVILKSRDTRTLDYLILMAVYCTRAPRDPGAWTYVGAAIRLCVELGLHRKPRRQVPSVESEMNKRRFWTAYFIDRDISIALGRPPSISDHDIDADLPLDVDEANDDDEVVRQAAQHPIDYPRNPGTTMSSFVHRLRLKRIESEIQHVVYRVDRPTKIPDTVIQVFLDQLNTWKDTVPFEARNFVSKPGLPYDGLEYYTIHYYRCVRFLLYPQLASGETVPSSGATAPASQPAPNVNMNYLRLCADACAGIAHDYRQLHRIFPVGFSALSIQSVFLAGLTLVYCAWLAPVNFLNVEGPLTDCQLLLYVITERYPSARKYRDIFERIKTTITTLIARGEHRPQNPVDVDADMRERFASLEGSWGMAGIAADFNQMISQMTGQEMPGGMGGFSNMDTAMPGPEDDHHVVAGSLGDIGVIWPGMDGVPPDSLGMDPMGGTY
ncbi:hypothetical protein GQ53DRAFT_203201 [Thozetella sp. PMI_491]|nr:hypothetical protein GQ53DRAFT_203201 [Thozetella sp. PMI_491]